MIHCPVLVKESLEHLAPVSGGWWADLTVGAGGHTEAILKATEPAGRVLGMDRDGEVLALARKRLEVYGDRLVLVQGNFQDLAAVVQEQKITALSGVLMDLGVSSFQLDDPARGFSFLKPGPLDMRMDRKQAMTAAEFVNHTSEKELADVFYQWGEERHSRRLAKIIARNRPLTDTASLVRLICRGVGFYGRLHPATRVFQALRIAVNDELASLERGLEAAAGALKDNGRIVVLSFHSLEDRIVKHQLRDKTRWENLTKHVIRPAREEIRANPRARSARLRAAVRRRSN